MSHSRLWIRLNDEKGGTKVIIAGTANKNKLSFEHTIDKIAKEIAKAGSK